MKLELFGFHLLLLLALTSLACGSSGEHDDDENGEEDWKEEDCECPKEHKPHNGHCYRFVPGPVSPDDAHAAATSVGAHLVTIEDEAEDMFVKGLCVDKKPNPKKKPSFDRITIGLLIVRSTSGDGTTITNVKRRFDGSECVYGHPLNALYENKEPWSDGTCTTAAGGTPVQEPKKSTTANCVQMIWNSESAGKWAATPCDGIAAGGYVMKFKSKKQTWPQNAVCTKAGYKHRRGKCYKVSSTKTATYEEADAACQADGGGLTAIHSESHFTFLKGLCARAFPQPAEFDPFVRFFTGFVAERDAAGKILSSSWKDGRTFDLNGLFDTKRIGLFKGDFPWCLGTEYNQPDTPEPKDGPSATKGFIVVNNQTSGKHAVGPRTADYTFLGAYICKCQAECPAGMTMTKGSCFGPTDTIPFSK